MALLQINEPLKAEKKITERKLAVGIDLGTTFCSVARLNNEGEVDFFKVDGKQIIPSIAAYQKNHSYYGYDALIHANEENTTLIHSVKRLIGIGYDKVIDPDFFPYKISSNGQNNLIKIHTEQGNKNPIEVSADLLNNIKKIVFNQLGEDNLEKTLDAVITVPAYFDDSQRQATKDAGKIAGINVLRIISEPTAAALAYGLNQKSNGLFAVYDLGGGTFDFSILQMQKEIFQVLACSGDSALGGNDFDQIIIKELLKKLELKVDEITKSDLFELWQRSKEIKHCLSEKNEVKTILKIANKRIDFKITQNEFNTLIEPLITKTLKICQLAIKDSKVDFDTIEGIVLVGGSSRIPLIHQRLKEVFKCQVFSNHDPDCVVAEGAAIQADNLIGNANNNALLLDVTPLSLGIEIMGGLVEKIIHRNTPIPIQKSQFFTTFKDNQTAISIHVLQGEREKVEDCRSLAKFSVKGLVPMKASSAKLEVTFQLDADGVLIVSAYEHKSKKQAEVMVKPSYGLNENEIKQMISNSFNHAKEDAYFRQMKSDIIKAKRLIEEVCSALETDKNLLSNSEIKEINQLIQDLKKLIQKENIGEVNKENLINLTTSLTLKANEFANKRLKNNLSQLNQQK